MRVKPFVILNTIVAALGGFLFGFDTAVISGTTSALEKVFVLDDVSLGFTVAVALYGTVIGSLIVGKPGEMFGGRKVLIVLAVFYTVSAIGSALTDSWTGFLIYRFIGGLGVGGASVMAPLYIAEISPAKYRGRLVAVNQLNIVAGILVSFFSNYIIANSVQHDPWRWMLGIETVPAILFFIFLFFIPNSPRWLVKKGRVDEARVVLQKIENEGVEKELDEIQVSLQSEASVVSEPLFQRKYSRPIMLAILIAMFNQLSGINAIMYYAPKIFEMTGVASSSALLQSVGVGFTNLIFTVVAMFIIDKFGRRTLMLTGSIGTAFFLALVGYAFLTESFENYTVIIGLLGFIAFFAFSQGAVIWVFLSEIFPNKIRAKGQALGSFTHWFMAALISWGFPIVAGSKVIGGGNAFVFFGVMMVLQFFFVWKLMPETKGRSLEQIQHDLGIK